jgi:type I restriction enzyme, S subunit
MSEWKEATLGILAEVQTGPFGSQLKNEQYITGGTPVVMVEHIKDFLIEDFIYLSVTDEDKNTLKKYTLKPGDIVFSRVGSVDLSALVKEHQDGWLFSSRMLRVRVKGDLDTQFLSYYLRQPAIRQFIVSISVGSTMPSINTEILKSLPVIYTSLEEQRKIANIFSCLDRKIENLRRQNEILEEIARSIFKHWFIDFEFPNADDKPYKSSGGVMVRSELGDIPEGWHIKRFDSLGELNRGKSRHRPRYAEHLYGGTYPFIQTGDIKASQGFITEYEQTYNDAGLAQSRLWKDETLCIIIAANIAETGILTFPTCFSDSVIGFVADSSICDVYFIHRMFKYKKKEIEVESIGSVQKKLNLETIAKIKFITPDIKKHNDLVAVFRKLRSKIICSKQKIRTLTKIRDTLLPKLMSCQLRVEG